MDSYSITDEKNLALRREVFEICRSKFHVKRLENLDSNESDTSDSLLPCGKPILRLLIQQSEYIRNHTASNVEVIQYANGNSSVSLVIQRLDDLIAIATEKFYAFPFKDVNTCWRQIFWEASLLKLSANVKDSTIEDVPQFGASQISQMIRIIDLALIMAGPHLSEAVAQSIKTFTNILQQIFYSELSRHSKPLFKRRRLELLTTFCDSFPDLTEFLPQVTNPITRKKNISFDTFEKHMNFPQDHDLGPVPLVITGSLDHWPALSHRPWNSPSYLLSQTANGERLVPIELGRSYVDKDWSQKIITFNELLEEYIVHSPPGTSKTGYLAQHDLLTQIPSLRNDIAIPDYCFASAPPSHKSSPLAHKHMDVPRVEEPLLNVWFGPAGTITPLHTDPYHNIIAQVVGRKYIRLYAPRESAKLYPRGVENGGIDMQNTSSVDLGIMAGWDGSREEQEEARKMFPLFEYGEFVDCVLESGECLYIPLGWWHYVRSLSISFSVSFWFN